MDRNIKLNRLIGLILAYSITLITVLLLLKENIVQWPFRKSYDFDDQINIILTYLPFFFLSLTVLLGFRFKEFHLLLFWRWPTPAFYVCLIISLLYAGFLLNLRQHGFYFCDNWWLVIVLSALNAWTEEIVFRFVFLKVIQDYFKSFLIANVLQAVLYGFIHYFIGGLWFFIGAVFYGLILGKVYNTRKCIAHCLICHFVIDLGAIGIKILIN